MEVEALKVRREKLLTGNNINKVFSKIVEQILPIISWVIFMMSLVLQIGVQNRMGIQRDLIVRNKKLASTVFSMTYLEVYKLILIAGIVFCIILFVWKRKMFSHQNISILKWPLSHSWRKYLIYTLTVSIVGIVMLQFYNLVSWLAYPWMLLSVLIMAVVQYSRLFYLIFFTPDLFK